MDVSGICCASEVSVVEEALYGVDGVKKVSVSIIQRQVHVKHHEHVEIDAIVRRLSVCTQLPHSTHLRGTLVALPVF